LVQVWGRLGHSFVRSAKFLLHFGIELAHPLARKFGQIFHVVFDLQSHPRSTYPPRVYLRLAARTEIVAVQTGMLHHEILCSAKPPRLTTVYS
jgi:hypothetical protein